MPGFVCRVLMNRPSGSDRFGGVWKEQRDRYRTDGCWQFAQTDNWGGVRFEKKKCKRPLCPFTIAVGQGSRAGSRDPGEMF